MTKPKRQIFTSSALVLLAVFLLVPSSGHAEIEGLFLVTSHTPVSDTDTTRTQGVCLTGTPSGTGPGFARRSILDPEANAVIMTTGSSGFF